MAGFVSYVEAKLSSRRPEQYGKGSVEGIAIRCQLSSIITDLPRALSEGILAGTVLDMYRYLTG